MALDADTLLDRIYLKEKATKWRNVAFFAFGVIAVILFTSFEDTSLERDYVARITIDGIVMDSLKLERTLKKIEENDDIRAVILRLDTPGGTAVAGEEIHLRLLKIAEKKPVIATMRTVCASAGYMIASAADHIIAREGTLTGSVGVILQTVEVTDLAENLGITPITVKSADLKGIPSPAEKLTAQGRRMMEDVVASYYANFLEMVVDRRKLDDKTKEIISSGRVFTGTQALELNLIDALGGEDEAMAWLEENHEISKDISVKSVWPQRKQNSIWGQLQSAIESFSLTKLAYPLDGLLLIWQGT